jgi:hypothetical protein
MTINLLKTRHPYFGHPSKAQKRLSIVLLFEKGADRPGQLQNENRSNSIAS